MNEWIEIAKVGEYKEGDLSEDFLKNVVASYDVNYFKSPITLDHKENGETYGRIESLKFENKSLFAKFVDVRDELITLIKTKAYTERSAEFYKDLDGRGAYLRAVSFVPFPAIKGMQPIKLSELPKGDYIRFSEVKKASSLKTLATNFMQFFQERDKMLNDEERKELEDLRAFKKEVEGEKAKESEDEKVELAELRKYKQEKEAEEAKRGKEEEAKFAEEASKFCDELITKGKLETKKKDDVVAFMKKLNKDDTIKFDEGKSQLQFYEEQLLLVPDGTFRKENSVQKYSKGSATEITISFDDEERLFNEITKYSEEHNVSFEEAHNKVLGKK